MREERERERREERGDDRRLHQNTRPLD